MKIEVHNIIWLGIDIENTLTPDKFGLVIASKLRIEGSASLPVSETGYRSNPLPIGDVDAAGGAVAFVTAWLDHEVRRTGCSGAQLTLFW